MMRRETTHNLNGACPYLNRAFTLIEILIVIAVIGVLASLLLAGIQSARAAADSTACASNLRQLAIATHLYCDGNSGYFPPSSWDINRENRHRWHGERDSRHEAFDFKRSPLHRYLQTDRIMECPAFSSYLQGFEAGGGGYGYNDSYVGSSRGVPAEGSSEPARRANIRKPSATVMFADCAFLSRGGDLIEYSFVTEPVFEAWGNSPSTPSVHFRHKGRANVAWCDGHVTAEPMGFSLDERHKAHDIGYIGTHDDNRLYDRK